MSLDAPAVALVWALMFARCYGGRVTQAEASILVLVVWAIYVTDHLLDGRKVDGRASLQERHRFCMRHFVPLSGLAILAVGESLYLAHKFMTTREALVGLPLALLVVLYMLAVHAGPVWLQRWLPKELTVGCLFAGGISFPLWSTNIAIVLQKWPPLILFAALCSLNCVAIECWESGGADKTKRHVPDLVRWADRHILATSIVLAITAVSSTMVSARNVAPVGGAIAASAGFILLLHHNRRRLSGPALRVLVDVALLVCGLAGLLISLIRG